MQAITNTHGITVNGAAETKIRPDIASIVMRVYETEDEPADAYKKTLKKSQDVLTYLKSSGVSEVDTSRIRLNEDYEISYGEERKKNFIGYNAMISINAILRDLNRIEEITCGALEAGANQLNDISFQTSQYEQHVNDVRLSAIQAAKDKAELYAKSFNRKLGEVLHIEDAEQGYGTYDPKFYVRRAPIQALDPESVTIASSVVITYSLN